MKYETFNVLEIERTVQNVPENLSNSFHTILPVGQRTV
jgi:hypothetical protein